VTDSVEEIVDMVEKHLHGEGTFCEMPDVLGPAGEITAEGTRVGVRRTAPSLPHEEGAI
jgi:hypothetical protein